MPFSLFMLIRDKIEVRRD